MLLQLHLSLAFVDLWLVVESSGAELPVLAWLHFPTHNLWETVLFCNLIHLLLAILSPHSHTHVSLLPIGLYFQQLTSMFSSPLFLFLSFSLYILKPHMS